MTHQYFPPCTTIIPPWDAICPHVPKCSTMPSVRHPCTPVTVLSRHTPVIPLTHPVLFPCIPVLYPCTPMLSSFSSMYPSTPPCSPVCYCMSIIYFKYPIDSNMCSILTKRSTCRNIPKP